MKDLLDLIVRNIVINADDVQIESYEEAGRITYVIHVHPDDMGRVIGRSGKVIKAIRNISRVVGIRNNQHYRINVAEDDQPAPEQKEAPVAETNDIEIEKSGNIMDSSSDDILVDALDVETE